MTYDVAIIGAGPAGSAAAIECARAGASVLLLEKDAFPRHKVCGEFLSPEVAEVLGELGCAALLSDAIPMEKARVHTASGRTLDFALTPAAHSLSRYALDAGLVREAVRLGVTFEQRHVAAPLHDARHADAPTPHTALPAALDARTTLPAWGRKIHENLAGGYFGFKAHFEGHWPAQVDLHFFDGGYVGVSPVEGGSINVCALVEKRLVRDAESIARRIIGDVPQQRWPFLYTGPLHPGWQGGPPLAAGDAAAFLDPFTGDGISLALRSGRLAARAALDNNSAQYRRELTRMCRGQFAAARVLRFGVKRGWIEAPVSWLLAKNPRLRRAVFEKTR